MQFLEDLFVAKFLMETPMKTQQSKNPMGLILWVYY